MALPVFPLVLRGAVVDGVASGAALQGSGFRARDLADHAAAPVVVGGAQQGLLRDLSAHHVLRMLI